MSSPASLQFSTVINAIKRLQNGISISSAYHEQMKQINLLLRNDESGLINSVLDFMIHAASVPMLIETKNENFDKLLKTWQNDLLNADIGMDIPRGLDSLSSEYFRERWKSSFIGLNIVWKDYEIGGEKWSLPSTMYFLDGASIYPENKTKTLSGTKYYLDNNKTIELKSGEKSNKTVLIRKPFNSWYELHPTPYLVKRGVLYNFLVKKAITSKQADVVSQIIPYLLLLRSGSDKLAELEMLASSDDLKEFKESLISAVKDHNQTGEFGKLVASLNYDTQLEHFIPDLTKLFDEKIVKSVNKNILAGLGLIELVGFSKNREEAILNPKVLIEEVKDGVNDWSLMLDEVTKQIAERNEKNHSRLVKNDISVIPGTIKAFLSDEGKRFLMSLHDRGLTDTEGFIDDVADKKINTVLDRRDKERKNDYEVRLYPRKVTNLEQYGNTEDNPENDPSEKEKQGKKPGSPESKNFENAAYKTIDDLPSEMKASLPIAAQIKFLKSYQAHKEADEDDDFCNNAGWEAVRKGYRQMQDNKWVKRG